jgi:hypothetical protein
MFIIIAAVLAAGGVVATAVSGLVNSATTQSNVTLTGISIASAGNSLTLTLKNTGTSPLILGNTDVITISGLSVTAPPSFTCTTPVSFAGQTPVNWAPTTSTTACGTAGTVSSVEYTGPSVPVSLLPGQQLAFAADPVLSVGTFSPGTAYTLTVTGPSVSFSQNVVAQ